MRLTIINDDNFVSIDGQGIIFDISNLLDTNIHAVQWYDNYGEIEYKRQYANNTIVVPQNQVITKITPFQNIIDAYYPEKQRQDAAEAQRLSDLVNTSNSQIFTSNTTTSNTA